LETIVYNGEVAYAHKIKGYYATKSGKVVSVKKKGGNGKLDFTNPKEMVTRYDRDGYKELCLSHLVNGVQKRVYIKVHQFVWEVFNGERNPLLTIDHIDNNKLNNNIDNLRQISREANTSKARKGCIPWQKGKKHSSRTFFNTFVDEVYVGTFDKQELKEFFGLSKGDIERPKTKRKVKMKLRLEKRVEDIERVDNN
jgi:hypothetical protein